MNWRERLEFVRDVHLKTLPQELNQIKKDLLCDKCGHYHGEVWANSTRMHLTIISMAMVQNGGRQVVVVPICDWCARNNQQALPWEKAQIKARELEKVLRLKEIKSYYPKGKIPWPKVRKYA